ncbi:hypothetical protein AAVH_33456, partial [Aphelenchoides avenae]
IYVEVRELTWEYRYGSFHTTNVNSTIGSDSADAWSTFLTVASTSHCILDTVLNAAWTIGFLVPCVYCNEMSRSAIPYLEDRIVDDDAKPVKDQILQKLTDPSWGISMGKFLRVDRSLVLTMISIVFTILVVWLQFGDDAQVLADQLKVR